MTNTRILQVWQNGPDRVLRSRSRVTTTVTPPLGSGRLIRLASSNYGSLPNQPTDPLPGSYDPYAWPYGDVETYDPGSTTTGVPPGTTLTTLTNPTELGAYDSTRQQITISDSNLEIDKYYIPYWLKINGKNIKFRRSELVGGNIAWPSTESAILDHRLATQSGLEVMDCSIHSQVPHYFINASIGHHATFDRCEVYHVVDGFGVYNNNTGTQPLTGEPYKNDGDLTVRMCWVHDFAFFYPDGGAHTDGTHNDGCQFHGGKRSQLLGNHWDWFAATASQFNTTSQALARDGANQFVAIQGGVDATATANRGYGSGVYANDIVSHITGNTVRGNYWYGCAAQLSIRNTGPNVWANNRHTKTAKLYSGTRSTGSQYIIRTNPSSLNGATGLYTNVWNDTGEFLAIDQSNPVNGRLGIRLDLDVPVIGSVGPASRGAGQTVTITGQYFWSITSVKFGAVAAQSFTRVNDTTITATLPAGTAGTVAVTVVNSAGTSNAVNYVRIA